MVARAALAAAAVIAFDKIAEVTAQVEAETGITLGGAAKMGDMVSVYRLACEYGALYRAAQRRHGEGASKGSPS